jgi:hypothetical protein
VDGQRRRRARVERDPGAELGEDRGGRHRGSASVHARTLAKCQPTDASGSGPSRSQSKLSPPWLATAPVRVQACAVITIARHHGAVGTASRHAAGRSASSGGSESPFVVPRAVAAGQRKTRPKSSVFHRARCRTGIRVGRRIGWQRTRGGGRRGSPRWNVNRRSPASWNGTVPASAWRLSRPSTPTSLAPNWLGYEPNGVWSGARSTPLSVVTCSG